MKTQGQGVFFGGGGDMYIGVGGGGYPELTCWPWVDQPTVR